jgi:hypothetical protein
MRLHGRTSAARVEWLGAALSVALFAYRARLSWNDSVDDAYIYLRYARNIAEHASFGFNVGQPVEGFSSPLWALLLAGLWKMGLVGLAPAKGLSLGCAFATIVVVFRTLRHVGAKWASAWILAALSLDCDFARWAVSGMDTPLFALGCATVLFAAAKGHFRLLAIAVGVLPWLRPEGLLVGGALGGLLLLRQDTRRFAWIAIVPVALLFALRLAVFHAVLPNTFYAKMTDAGPRDYSGASYIASFIKRRPMLVMLAAGALLMARKRLSLAATVAIVISIATFSFAALAHGDWMPNRRFLVPVLGCLLLVAATLQRHMVLALAVLGTETVLSSARRIDQGWREHENIVASFATPTPEPIAKPAPLDWMPSHLLRNLSYYVLPGDTVAHVDMGQLPYVMHDVTFLDGFGLVDAEVARLTFSPSSARTAAAAQSFFRLRPTAAIVVSSKEGELPLTLGQAAFVFDPRFAPLYREHSRVPTWGGRWCILFVRRDRIALDERTARAQENHWLSRAGDVRSALD